MTNQASSPYAREPCPQVTTPEGLMHVFVIPSWYPHRCFPLEGAYIRDQALAIAELRPQWRVTISTWGQGEGFFSLNHLRRSPGCLWSFLMRPEWSERALAANLVETQRPTPSWSERVARGNRAGLLRANRFQLARASERWGAPTVLHAHVSYPAGWIAWRLSEETGIPFVVTEHMGPFPLPVYRTRSGSLLPQIADPLRHAATRIAVSPHLASRMESFGVGTVQCVPNLVDERIHLPGSPREDGLFRFLTVCGMYREKGIHDLIDAVALLLPHLDERRRSMLRFRLGGTGPALSEFKQHARHLKLEPWFEWLGLITPERARAEFATCDAFVLPSHHESFGIVFVEAQAAGKPAVGTRCGGPEAIVSPECGVLVEPAQPDELARAMQQVLDQRREYDDVAIRQHFVDHFSRPAVVDRLDTIYERVLASTGEAAVDKSRGLA